MSTKPRKKKSTSVDLIIIVDRSGSMFDIAGDMSGGLNKFIEEQKKVSGQCRVTLADFDTQELRFLHLVEDISKVEPYKLEPRGGTPLFDTISSVFGKFSDVAKPKMDKTICLIITDGEENSSKEVKDKDIIVQLIKDKQEKEGWEVIYLGADHDAFSAGYSMGTSSAAQYNKTKMSVQNMYGTIHNKMSAIRSCSLDSAALNQNDVDAIVSETSVKWDES